MRDHVPLFGPGAALVAAGLLIAGYAVWREPKPEPPAAPPRAEAGGSASLPRDPEPPADEAAADPSARERGAPLDASLLDAAFERFEAAFDPGHGGFGGAPKVPTPVNQNFLLRYYARKGDERALAMVAKTLLEMSRGGIYDHLGGGFHSRSVDAGWRMPRFGKTLRDNAQLAVNFLEAYQAGKDPDSARVARETLDYLLRDMRRLEGGFFAAEAAGGTPSPLGAFYLWGEAEIARALGRETADVFSYRYGVLPGGNVRGDPVGGLKSKNILYAARTLEETAARFGGTARGNGRLLDKARKRLLAARAKRPRPALDDNILASWNGLAISAFAKGFQVLEEPAYLAAAESAARFVRKRLYDPGTRVLHHGWRDGRRAAAGMAADYAFFAQGLLDLYEASFDPGWLEWAEELTDVLQERLSDRRGAYYAADKGAGKRPGARAAEVSEGDEPSASSVAALNLLRLGQFTGREDLRRAAEKTLGRFSGRMRDDPLSLPQMLVAADYAAAKPRQVIIAGEVDDPATREMLRMVHARYLPDKILMVVPPGEAKDRLARRLPVLEWMAAIDGKPTAYICVNFACELPTNDLQAVARLLEEE
ncbi:MAG: thioredoxin domain-containing protein [Elusimicrobiota bacterium]